MMPLDLKANIHPLSLDDLPRYSPWPSRLLSGSKHTLFHKSRASVYREYERDKWAKLLGQIEVLRPTLDELECLQFDGRAEIAISLSGQLHLCAPLVARRALASMIADRVFSHYDAGVTIAELGAGTGAIITRIAKDPRFSAGYFVAGDFSPSSLRVVDYASRVQGVTVRSAPFDFMDRATDLDLPPDSLMFTSFSVAYHQGATHDLWVRLATMRPRAIVVAEPIYQFFREDTLLGLLRRRYFEANDYNQAILPSIQEAESMGLFRVSDIVENVIGINPLCPVSLLSLLPR